MATLIITDTLALASFGVASTDSSRAKLISSTVRGVVIGWSGIVLGYVILKHLTKIFRAVIWEWCR